VTLKEENPDTQAKIAKRIKKRMFRIMKDGLADNVKVSPDDARKIVAQASE
jgi:hypothetical protein